jgi:hypothetical protein
MSQNSQNSIVTTTAGIFGGVGKLFLSSPLIINNINFESTLEVAFYAAVSAIVGYAVKVGIDKLKNYIRR